VEGSTSVTATARAPREPQIERRGTDAYVAEFIGTLLLTFFICFVVSVNSAGGLGFTDWAVIGLVHLLILAMLIHTLGGASGGHFNPAVTVTLGALRKISWPDAGVYLVLQLLGGLAGALIVRLLLDQEGAAANYGAPAVSEQFLEGRAISGFFVEAIGAFALMWAIMGVAVSSQGARDWAGFVIGGTLGLAALCFGPVTGAAHNPARALGPAVVGEAFNGLGTFVVAFVLGPLVGALLAGMLYTAGIIGPGRLRERRPVDTLSGREESPRAGEPVRRDREEPPPRSAAGPAIELPDGELHRPGDELDRPGEGGVHRPGAP
jgi:glycerol uptake facilitator protein